MKRVFVLVTIFLFAGCDKGYQLLIKSTNDSMSYIEYPGSNVHISIGTLRNLSFAAHFDIYGSEDIMFYGDRLEITVNEIPVSYKIRDGYRHADSSTFMLAPRERKSIIYNWRSENIKEGDEIILRAKDYLYIDGTFYDLEEHIFVTREM